MNEREIDLIDLIYQVVKKWRLLIIFMLLFAILAEGVAALRSYRSQNNNDEIVTQDSVKLLADVLTDTEKANVDIAYDTYTHSQDNLDSAIKYNQDSRKMQLDANNVPTLRIQYLIDTHYKAVYPVVEQKDYTNDIITSLSSAVTGTQACEEIAEGLQWKTKAVYIKELLSAYRMEDDVLVVDIIAPAEKDCEAIGDIIDSLVIKKSKELEKIYGDFDVSQLTSQYFENVNADLKAAKQAQIDTITNLKTAINNMTVNMTQPQIDYYNALVALYNQDNGKLEEDEEVPLGVSDFINIKYIILGLFLGAFLVCCYVGIKYIVSGTLKVQAEIKDGYNLSILGVQSTQSKKPLGGIDKWLLHLFHGRETQFSDEENLRMITAGIRIAAQKAGMKKIFIAGSGNDAETNRVKDLIQKNIEGQVEVSMTGPSVIYDPEALEQMALSDGVVVVERIDYSRYEDITKELEICRTQEIPVIGAVVIR